MMQEKKKFRPLTSEEICRAYEALLKDGQVTFPIPPDSKEKAETIAVSINSEYFGTEIYGSPEEKAVAYFYLIIKDHIFTDGNKRTATLCFLAVCKLNDLVYTQKFPLDEVAVFLEQNEEKDYHEMIKLVAILLFELPIFPEDNTKDS